MAWKLRIYETASGRTAIDDGAKVFDFAGVRLNGVLFDDSNIAEKSEVTTVSNALSALEIVVNNHINQNGIDIGALQTDVQSLYALLALYGNDIARLIGDLPIEERIVATAGQTIFVSSLLRWSADHAIQDIVVYRNGVRLTQDVTGGTLVDYTKLDNTRIRLNNRTAYEGDRITIRMERSELSSSPTNYFFDHVTNTAGRGISSPDIYTVNSDRLFVWMNGILLVKSVSVGGPNDRYEESSPSFITLGASASVGDVVSFLNQTQSPANRFVQTGVTGTTLTIPAYVMGSERLRVWRNGVLMNHQAIGSPVLQYTETSTTSIDLAEPATAGEIFVFENGYQVPQFREDITGLTGTTIALANSYVPGDQHLLVFRNGVLMFKSATLGDPIDRYSESGTSTIELEVVATADEVFSVIYL